MRVTDRLIFQGATTNLGRAREKEELASQEAQTGIRVNHPGDDPGAAGLIVTHRVEQKRFAAIQQSVGRASDELGSTDGALDTVTNSLARARELAVQLSNGTYSANERAGAAVEISGLVQSVLGALNTKVGSHYVFGGNKDQAPPFDPAGNYAGDDGIHQVEIAPGVYQAASVNANVGIKGSAGGVDVIATLQALQAALQSNNVAGVQASLNPLEQSTSQVSNMRAQVGSSMNVLDAATAINKASSDSATSKISTLADADAIASASNLALAERSLEAAYTAASKSFQLTLVDKLR